MVKFGELETDFGTNLTKKGYRWVKMGKDVL